MQMTEDILERPITYIVKIDRTRTETALIPIIAMTAEEAVSKAWARCSENSHEWKLTYSQQHMHGVVDTRGFANEFKTKEYKQEKANQ